MSRLADYFVVVGYDHEKDRGGCSTGKIVQRFPLKDWEGCPFMQGIELFCRPTGWVLTSKREPPEFFVAVLTDVDAERHYCACLTFSETIARPTPKTEDPDVEAEHPDSALLHHSLLFSPKSLVLVSRVDYFDVFRNCLGILYTAYVDKLDVQLEVLVGNILACVHVPPPGGPQMRFSIGAGDRQALQPPLSSSLPVSRATVHLLFTQLGIQNTLMLYSAAMTDHKILFHSQSNSRLTDACQALVTLFYPLKNSHVYIPILPSSLADVLNTPTPFIAGVNSLVMEDTSDLLDVIIVDIDGGSIHVPECVHLSLLPEPMLTRTKRSLTMILNPDLLIADQAFPPSSPKKPQCPEQMDKEIRAVFIRLHCELLASYRSYLTVIRIHPEPFITFQKANFLGHRGMVEEEFLVKLLDGMAMATFVQERGAPYRLCDIFDEVYSVMQDQLKQEIQDSEKMLSNIQTIAQQLQQNEVPNPQPYVQKIPKPTEGAYARIHQLPFPILDTQHVESIMEEEIPKQSLKRFDSFEDQLEHSDDHSRFSNLRPSQLRIVPMGVPMSSVMDQQKMFFNNARRLEVLRNCVNFIFENKISDAKIIFSAVQRALKSRLARLSLTQELAFHIRSNRAMLEHQQFDLVVKLLNCALQEDSILDENGVAAAILPLATAFCRKLCTGVIQFAYTLVQEHPIWASQQFWESAFYQDVQKEIKRLYLPHFEEHVLLDRQNTSPDLSQQNPEPNTNKRMSLTPDPQRRPSSGLQQKEIGALDIAAEQMRVWSQKSPAQQEELINSEESTVYSQAIHYTYRMVYLRVPLETSKPLKTFGGQDWESNTNSNITPSLAESDSVDAESGFDETEISDVGASVVRFVTRFVDKVCRESGVTEDHIKALHQMIPGVVAMHIETLEAVNRESARLPPIQKPKILKPRLLPGEEIVMDNLRVYLLPDGREEGTGGNMGGPSLLPAEGAISLTNYRIVFKGIPCDPLACEQVVVRYFPISTLTKEKQIKLHYTTHIDQLPKEGLQIRSNVFQLMKIGFDEEVKQEDIEVFRKLSNKYRNPVSVLQTFAFSGHVVTQPTQHHKHKEKNASLRHFAKKTLIKTARKAGIKTKPSKKDKFVLAPQVFDRKTLGPSRGSATSLGSDSESDRPNSEIYDDLSIIDESELLSNLPSDPKFVDKLLEKSGYKDYLRLGFEHPSHPLTRGSTNPFRISTVNLSFSVCRSYPALLVVPTMVSDDSIRKLARTHQQSRLPVVSWRHPRTKAVLLRASEFHTRGLMGMLKPESASNSSTGEPSTAILQEKYFAAIIAATPSSGRNVPSGYSDSLTSLDSLMLSSASEMLHVPETPDMIRRTGTSLRNPQARQTATLTGNSLQSMLSASSWRSGREGMFTRAMGTLRSSSFLTLPRRSRSHGSYKQTFGRISSMKDKSPSGRATTNLDTLKANKSNVNGTLDGNSYLMTSSVQGLKRAALYVLGEKAQMKNIKTESFPNCDFIPVEFYEVRHVKASFKKLMRACVPSSFSPTDTPFLKAVEDSDWLPQVQRVLQLAGATVDLMDVQGSSVMICLEDGWDVTTQVLATAQVLMDPHYRTLEGFRALVEKEWLSFGHRFTHRSNQTQANLASGFAPVFLQFLDVVHQIRSQFPLSFEFNDFYLRFLAYHYVSNRFRTFMLDNELERMEGGWLLDDKRFSRYDDLDEEGGFAVHRHTSSTPGASLWDFVDKHNYRSPLFYNFLYAPLDHDSVLRPYSHLSNLQVWEYYLTEDLAHGPPYEMDIMQEEINMNREENAPCAKGDQRTIINGCYDNIKIQQPESFVLLLQEVHRLETELDHLPQKWKSVWDKTELPNGDSLRRNTSFNTQNVRLHGRSLHKRSTLEILVKGKMLGEASKRLTQPHRFEKFTYTTPVYCDYCSQVLWGLLKTGMRCSDCGYNCHEKCIHHVSKNCTKLKMVGDGHSSSSNGSHTGVGSDSSSSASVQAPRNSIGHVQMTDSYHSNSSPSQEPPQSLQGYLLKKGHYLKGWKQRWFVLDAAKHQMQYYDSKEDPSCRGSIDLLDVVAVHPIKSEQGPVRKGDDSVFELRTNKRIYHFQAPDPKTAAEWIDRIHSFI